VVKLTEIEIGNLHWVRPSPINKILIRRHAIVRCGAELRPLTMLKIISKSVLHPHSTVLKRLLVCHVRIFYLNSARNDGRLVTETPKVKTHYELIIIKLIKFKPKKNRIGLY